MVIKTGKKINPQLKKVVNGGPYDGQPLDKNNHLCSLSGLVQDTMANPSSSPTYSIISSDCTPDQPTIPDPQNPEPTPVDTSCENMQVELSKNNNIATANVSGGAPPYFYYWDDGQTTKSISLPDPNAERFVIVNDSLFCVKNGTLTGNSPGGLPCNVSRSEFVGNTVNQTAVGTDNDFRYTTAINVGSGSGHFDFLFKMTGAGGARALKVKVYSQTTLLFDSGYKGDTQDQWVLDSVMDKKQLPRETISQIASNQLLANHVSIAKNNINNIILVEVYAPLGMIGWEFTVGCLTA